MIIIFVLASFPSTSAHTISAEEIRWKVISGEPVFLDGVDVAGDLNLSGIEPPVVREPLAIVNSNISGLDLCGLEFRDQVNFTGSRVDEIRAKAAVFEEGAIFDLLDVSGNTDFEGAHFQKDASFFSSNFSGITYMNYTTFEDYGYFADCRFAKGLHISDSTFQGFADFYGARFYDALLCLNTKFIEGAGFVGCEFGGPTYFGMSSFYGYTSFGGSVFRDLANFVLARFDKAVYFGEILFEGDALFGLAHFGALANFAGTSFVKELNLNSASIDAFVLDNATFESSSKIKLKGAEFRRITAPWPLIKGHIVYDGATYLALVKNYQELEWFEDADDCYYDYRREAQQRKPFGWSKIFDYLAWITCGYGVRPSYSFLWSIASIILFGIIFYLGGIKKQTVRSDANPERLKDSQETELVPISFHDGIYFSALVYLYSTSTMEFKPTGIYRYLVILEGLLGWFFLSLFLVSLGRVMIR